MMQDDAIILIQWRTNGTSYMIYRTVRTAPFSATLNDPYPRFYGYAII